MRKSIHLLGIITLFGACAGLLVTRPLLAEPGDDALRDEALQAMKAAVRYYREKVASHGGYVYYYTDDLKQRWGEGKADQDTVFVQPPGTPTVGMAYLQAHAATADPYYLDAARETAQSLVEGQLQSGGWTQVIHFSPARRMGKYRHRKGGDWNASSLDDGQTQAALQFLMRADQALGFKNERIHEAAGYALDALLKAQFANGGFPQVWTGPVEHRPPAQARFPDYDWKTEGRIKNYWDQYTLNDDLAGTVSDTLITAHQVYGEERCKSALERLGDFLILAQMPTPQPGWCQQYNGEMVPIWARKFEPPAISGSESQDAMETLIKISRYTGQSKYLKPIPSALEYFTNKCLLSDGRVARFYEFKTNKPLYMDQAYQLTYDDSNVPSHYGWKRAAHFKEIERVYQEAKQGVPAKEPQVKPTAERVREIVRRLDGQGRWVETYAGEPLVGQPKFELGFRYVSSDVFSRNVATLAEYVAQGP